MCQMPKKKTNNQINSCDIKQSENPLKDRVMAPLTAPLIYRLSCLFVSFRLDQQL